MMSSSASSPALSSMAAAGTSPSGDLYLKVSCGSIFQVILSSESDFPLSYPRKIF
jgi:hypothetical protein